MGGALQERVPEKKNRSIGENKGAGHLLKYLAYVFIWVFAFAHATGAAQGTGGPPDGALPLHFQSGKSGVCLWGCGAGTVRPIHARVRGVLWGARPDLLHPVQSLPHPGGSAGEAQGAARCGGVAAEVGRVVGHGDDRGHGPAADEGVPQAGM